jgi:RNA polymerase sigma factor (sigma-70 family)
MRGAAEPEDLTSEVFLAVFERLSTFKGNEPKFRSWVFTIAHSKLVDARRRMARRPWSEVNVDEVVMTDLRGGDVETEALDALSIKHIQDLLAHLPDVQREVLLLRIIAGLTVPEVAAAMGKSPGAIKQHQRRALTTLRERFQRQDVTI